MRRSIEKEQDAARQTAASIRLLALVASLTVTAESVATVSHHLSATTKTAELLSGAIKAAGSQSIITGQFIIDIHSRLRV